MILQAECYAGMPGDGGDSGVQKPIWVWMVTRSSLSALRHAIHLAMAVKVHWLEKWKRSQGAIEAVDPEEEESRKAKARELWIKIAGLT